MRPVMVLWTASLPLARRAGAPSISAQGARRASERLAVHKTMSLPQVARDAGLRGYGHGGGQSGAPATPRHGRHRKVAMDRLANPYPTGVTF